MGAGMGTAHPPSPAERGRPPTRQHHQLPATHLPSKTPHAAPSHRKRAPSRSPLHRQGEKAPPHPPGLPPVRKPLYFPCFSIFSGDVRAIPGAATLTFPVSQEESSAYGCRGQRGSLCQGGCGSHAGGAAAAHPPAPRPSSHLLSYSRRLFRFRVTLNCRRSHVSCLPPCKRGAGRALPQGHRPPQTPPCPKARAPPAPSGTAAQAPGLPLFAVVPARAGRCLGQKKSIRETASVILRARITQTTRLQD